MDSQTPSRPPSYQHAESHGPKGSVPALVVGALGIVFGDIGTSPLYTLKECTHGPHGVPPTHDNVLGVLSLIFYALMLVVTVKYLVFIMRADNRGEGGILALLALLPEKLRGGRERPVGLVAVLVIAGAALLYGDGMITPAISVLSAVEGLEVATPTFKPYIIPITCAILLALFLIQSRGTGSVGKLFGPIMVLWFATLAVLGVRQIVANTVVLRALDPRFAIEFFAHHGRHGFMVLGSVVLAVTGGEALYADMGHFGRRPIRIAWLVMVLPCLVLAYFGQGAMLLAHPEAAENPFFAMAPEGPWTYALVVLATLATIIASQALISGAFSLTHQAISLGYFPRVTVKYTSKEAEGQIYVPEINWLLAIMCIALVLSFRASSRLAAAYGIAVTGTMAITSVAFYLVTRETWKWPVTKALPLLLLFLAFDLPFLAANALKFLDGGWVPIVVAAFFLVGMITWRRGRFYLGAIVARKTRPLKDFLADLEAMPRKEGCAIFMASSPDGVPAVLAYHASRLKVLEEQVVLVTVKQEHTPSVDRSQRVSVEQLAPGFYRVVLRYGFMETPHVPRALRRAKAYHGLEVNIDDATYYLGRETFLATSAGNMGAAAEGLFSFLSRNARSATTYFGLPPGQVVELGTMIDL